MWELELLNVLGLGTPNLTIEDQMAASQVAHEWRGPGSSEPRSSSQEDSASYTHALLGGILRHQGPEDCLKRGSGSCRVSFVGPTMHLLWKIAGYDDYAGLPEQQHLFMIHVSALGLPMERWAPH